MAVPQTTYDDFHNYLNNVLDFAHQGFTSVNVVLGLLVAVVAAFMLVRYSPLSILLTTVGATLALLIIQLMVPVIDHHAAFKLPDIMVESFWHQFGLLAAGLFIIISVLYVVKRAFMRDRVVH